MKNKDHLRTRDKIELGNALAVFLIQKKPDISMVQARRVFAHFYSRLRAKDAPEVFDAFKTIANTKGAN